jgi:hypothetical protein
MRWQNHRLALVALVLCSYPLTAQSVIYNNGLPNGVSGLNLTSATLFEDFTFASTTTFDGIRFWDVQTQQFSTGSFGWRIYSDGGGLPGSAIAVGSASAIQLYQGMLGCNGSCDRYQNDLFIGSMTFAPGTYWLNLSSTSLLSQYWETTGPNGTSQALGGPPGFELAFELTGAASVTPEPATMLLMATGLAGIGAAGKKRKRR